MIFDYSKVRGKIKEKFGTQSRFADSLDISRGSLSARLNNSAEFTSLEIFESCKLLEIPMTDIPQYFLRQKFRNKNNKPHKPAEPHNKCCSGSRSVELKGDGKMKERVRSAEQQQYIDNRNAFWQAEQERPRFDRGLEQSGCSTGWSSADPEPASHSREPRRCAPGA